MEEMYKCEKCLYSSKLKANLKYHVKAIHDKLQDMQCPNCNYKTAWGQTHLRQHLKKHHKEAKKCQLCGLEVSSEVALTEHLLSSHIKST